MTGDALRIVAPGACEGAALEERGAAEPRPVLGGHALDLEDEADRVVLAARSVHAKPAV